MTAQSYVQQSLFDVADFRRPARPPRVCPECDLPTEIGLSRLPDGDLWIACGLTHAGLWRLTLEKKCPVGMAGGPLGVRLLNWRSVSEHTFGLVQRKYAAERVGDSDLYRPSARLLLDMHGEAVAHFGRPHAMTRWVRHEVEEHAGLPEAA